MSHPTCLDETRITQPITVQTSLSQAWWIPLIDFCPNFQKKKQLSVLHFGPDICCRNKSCFFQIPYFHICQALHTWQQHTEPLLPPRMMVLQFCRCRLFVAINYTPFSRRWSFGVHLQFWGVFLLTCGSLSEKKSRTLHFQVIPVMSGGTWFG